MEEKTYSVYLKMRKEQGVFKEYTFKFGKRLDLAQHYFSEECDSDDWVVVRLLAQTFGKEPYIIEEHLNL